MKKKTGASARGASQKSATSSNIEEASSEMKFFTTPRNQNTRASFTGGNYKPNRRGSGIRHQSMRNRKVGKTANDGDTPDDRDKSKKNSSTTGNNNNNSSNEDESATSPLTNFGEGNGTRNSDNPLIDVGPRDKREELINDVRNKCGIWVNNDRVQITMVTFIFINAIMMGLATFDFIKTNPDWDKTFETFDKVFLYIFTIELFMQGIYHGFYLLTDGWLMFDLIIISLSWALAHLQIVRAFRIFRAFRLVTRVKIMKDLILGKQNNFASDLTSN